MRSVAFMPVIKSYVFCQSVSIQWVESCQFESVSIVAMERLDWMFEIIVCYHSSNKKQNEKLFFWFFLEGLSLPVMKLWSDETWVAGESLNGSMVWLMYLLNVCVRVQQRSSCLTIDWSAIGCCSHMSEKGWTMYPWCPNGWWTSRSWSVSVISELLLSGSQVRTLLCHCCLN